MGMCYDLCFETCNHCMCSVDYECNRNRNTYSYVLSWKGYCNNSGDRIVSCFA